jgi:putative component of toxin-antitoxin plasmid stabilization module
MPNFELEKIDEIKGKIDFYYLKIDGKIQYKEFSDEIEKDGTYINELDTIQARFQDVAELRRLPNTKFRPITPKNDPVKEYEIKTSNLRVYFIHIEKKGHAIILLGKKTNQIKDIKLFRRIKSQYLND